MSKSMEGFPQGEHKSTIDLEDMYKRLSSYIKYSKVRPAEYDLIHKLIEDNLQIKKDIEELKKDIK